MLEAMAVDGDAEIGGAVSIGAAGAATRGGGAGAICCTVGSGGGTLTSARLEDEMPYHTA